MNNFLYKFSLLFLLSFLSQNSMAAGADDFIIKVKTDFPGTSTNNEFTIQTLGTGYNYNVDCNFDGTFEATAQTGDYVCVYGSPGIKFIRIEENNGDGTGFPRIYYNNTGDHRKLMDIAQWGTGKWTSMGAAFRGAINMAVSAGDVPNLSNVTNLASMFRFAFLANPDTTNWDVSNVTTMHSMFRSASAANPNTSNWNTSNVTVMTDMFRNATSANPDVSSWDITQVTDMSLMFANVTLPTADYDAMLIHFANQNVKPSVIFDGGNSQYCNIPAQNARASLIANKSWSIVDGNQCANSDPLNDFVFTVTTNFSGSPTDATFTIPTFGTGYKYSVDCNNDGTLEAVGVITSYVCDYSALGGVGTYTIRIKDALGDKTGYPRFDLFYASTEKDEVIDIVQWGTGVWTSMESAFRQATNLQISATDAPDLSQVTSLQNTFRLALALTTVGSNWDTSNITDMSGMFSYAFQAQPQTSSWDTSNVTNMAAMFAEANSAQPDTSNWNTAKVQLMTDMFTKAYLANPDTSGWDISLVTDMTQMFADVTLPTADYDALLSGFNGQVTQAGVVFSGGNSKYCDVAARDGLINTHGWSILDGGLDPTCPATPADDFVFVVKTDNLGSSSDTQFTIPTNGAGYNYNVDCDDDNPGINTASAQTGNYTCNYASAGTYTIRISDNIGDKTGFPRIYFNAELDNRKIIELKQWGNGVWTNMAGAFYGAENMIVSATDVPDLSQVSSAISMFSGASLANPNTTNWDVSNIQYMQSMFRVATAANPDTSQWNTSSLTNTFAMFNGATSANPDVSNWNTSNIVDMRGMFSGATSATPDMGSWDITSISVPNSMEQMFANVTLPTAIYDAALANFNSQVTANGIVFDGGNSQYCNVAAHDGLINSHGWTITDGGIDPNCPGPADNFVFVVKTDNLGSSSDTQFTIPTNGAGYNYNIDCDDDNPGINTASAQTGNYTCNYASAGTYTIRISDNVGDKTGFPRIYFNAELDYRKIIELKQWGNGIWTNMASAFYNASNMIITATDVPDLSQVSNTINMFSGASLANPNTTNWDVSNIQFMQSMFRDAVAANPDTSQWNTSSLTNTFAMFNGAIIANPNVQSWDVSNVTNMSLMFQGVTLPISSYDALLNHFNSQAVISGISFSGGNSTYCNVAAHDGLENTHGWTITDGGLDPSCPGASDDIFADGFEIVIIFKAAVSQFNYDFSEVSIDDMDETPLLIAKGLDDNKQSVIQIYLRNDLGQLQIRMDNYDNKTQLWKIGQWQSIDNKQLTTISWY